MSTEVSRYWDYPFEKCMVRETREDESLSIAIKFYGSEESMVDLTHELYVDVARGRGAEIDVETYERGKERQPPNPPRWMFEHGPEVAAPDAEVLARAVAFAITHHGNQRRKDLNNTPYMAHLLAVCALALEDRGSQDHAVAAILHDTLEDCATVTYELLIAEFGSVVADLVAGCTDRVEGEEPLPWRERKQAYLDHLRIATHDVLLVSNADKLHNLSSLVADIVTGPANANEALQRFRDPQGVVWYYEQLGEIFRWQRPGYRNQRRFDATLSQLRDLMAEGT